MITRKIKSQRKADLRKKNLGLGIAKDEATKSKPKKILFDDDFVASDYDSDEHDHAPQQADARNSEDEENSSDDEVEQVSASAAKQQAIEQFAAERQTRKEESAYTSKRKRKAKDIPEKPKQPIPESEDEEELDEDFFAMVDEERKNETKAKKRKKDMVKNTIGRHTTFISEADDPNVLGSITKPIVAEHNIEVVVLPYLSSEDGLGDNAKAANDKQLLSLSAGLGTQPSETALLFCRGSQARSSAVSEKGFEAKRSKMMKYSLSRGMPSSNFAKGSRKRC
eukprot:scaffold764_cov240-Chaetoceros_neogracile.AAC.5